MIAEREKNSSISNKEGRKCPRLRWNGVIIQRLLCLLIGVFLVVGTITTSHWYAGHTRPLEERLPALDVQEKLAALAAWPELETALRQAGCHPRNVLEAEGLYAHSLSAYSTERDFAERLIECFSKECSDRARRFRIYAAFGLLLSPQEFDEAVAKPRALYIECDDFVDPTTKNNLDLVKWAKVACQQKWGYVWGTFGRVLDEKTFWDKIGQHPKQVGEYAEWIYTHWMDRRVADCVGLIKGYGWFDPTTNKIGYNTNGMPDIWADQMYLNATVRGTIDTIPEIPGLAVWHEGHIGVYIGNGRVIQSAGTEKGVLETALEDTEWTHWFQIPYISYIQL